MSVPEGQQENHELALHPDGRDKMQKKNTKILALLPYCSLTTSMR
jgi:hypothetical protein